MTPAIALIIIVSGLAMVAAIATKEKLPRLRKIVLLVCCLIIATLVAASLFTPWNWQWNKSNLQVKIYNAGHARMGKGSYAEGFGWSKLRGLMVGWLPSRCGQGTWIGGRDKITASSEASIASVSPNGVSVRFRYNETFDGKTTSFDKVIFVPSRGEARVDVSPDIYLTGVFE